MYLIALIQVGEVVVRLGKSEVALQVDEIASNASLGATTIAFGQRADILNCIVTIAK